MNKTDLERLADDRIIDAKALLDAGRWSAAYYLAGYSVECDLKACIAKLVKAEDFPDKKLAEKSWSHEVEKLLDAAGLKADRDADVNANPILGGNGATVNDWTEKSRYEQKNQSEAESLYNAITDSNDGVLKWIKLHW